MLSKLRIIVTGMIAQYPLGGVAWDYLQYVLGLVNLGHDVYYFEDTGQCPFNPIEGGLVRDHSYNVKYLSNVMSQFGLSDKWAYRSSTQQLWSGLIKPKRKEVIETADLLLNLSGSLERPYDYRQIKRLAYIDTDPVFTQVKLARGQVDFHKLVDAHDVHFSFGECLSNAIPLTGHRWLPTRQPVVLGEWNYTRPHRDVFTTVMNWTSHNDVVYKGRIYGQKNVEFKKYLDLPGMVTPIIIEIAVNTGRTSRTPLDLLNWKGWHIVDPDIVCGDLNSYRNYIESSKAEWSIAKNGYVLGQPGWFSCRSVCYLAAGRPVIVQETGFSKVIPTGEGLLTFTNLEEAVESINKVQSDYSRHAKSARAIAEEYFDSAKVLTQLIGMATNSNE